MHKKTNGKFSASSLIHLFYSISGLQSHESNLISESKSSQMDWSWQDPQLSQNSSESKLSVMTSEEQKSDINKDFTFLKNIDSDSIVDINNKIDSETMKTDDSVESMVIEEDDSTIDSQKQNKVKDDKTLDMGITEQKTPTTLSDDIKKYKEKKSIEIKKDEKKKTEEKHSRSSHKSSSKDDKHRKSSSSKDKDKSSSRHSSSSKDRDSKEGSSKVKDKAKDESKNSKEKESKIDRKSVV